MPAWVPRLLPGLLTALLAGCQHVPEPAAPPPPSRTSTGASVTAGTPGATAATGAAPLPGTAPAQPAGRGPAITRPSTPPPPSRHARHWDDYRLHAAQRLVWASPGGTYDGPVPEPLLAIPVLEIELNADGSVRRINVLRHPKQALDTVELAMAAVRRAAPFGPVGHLPRPWKFNEVFLFNDERRFKPRSLDD